MIQEYELVVEVRKPGRATENRTTTEFAYNLLEAMQQTSVSLTAELGPDVKVDVKKIGPPTRLINVVDGAVTRYIEERIRDLSKNPLEKK